MQVTGAQISRCSFLLRGLVGCLVLAGTPDTAKTQEDAAAKQRAAERHRAERQAERDSLTAPTDSLAVRPDSLGRLRIPPLNPSLDPFLPAEEVLTRDQIDWTGNLSLGELLSSRSGFMVRDLSSSGQYHQLWATGMDGRGIAILVNGRSAVNPADGLTNMDRFPTDMIDRLETITGPRSFLYGWHGAGGAVNIITREIDTNVPVTSLAYTEGPYDFQQVSGSFAQNVSRGINLSLDFDHSATAGRYTNSLNDAWVMMASVRVAVTPRVAATVSERYSFARTDLNGGVNSTRTSAADAFLPLQAFVANPDAYEKISRHDVDLLLSGMFLGDSSDVTQFSLYYSHALREFRDEENRGTPNGLVTRSDHSSSWSGFSLKQALSGGIHRFVAGTAFELRHLRESPTMGGRKTIFGSLWAKHEITPVRGLVTGLFGRLERGAGNSGGGAGFDVSFSPLPWLRLTAGGSVARRFPTFTEAYWRDSVILGGTSPVPETHRVIEARVEVAPWRDGLIGLRAFRRSVDDPILFSFVEDRAGFPVSRVANGRFLLTRGLELSFRTRMWLVELEGKVLWQERPGGDAPAREVLPGHAGSGGLYLSGNLLDGRLPLRAGARVRWQSGFRGDRLNPEALSYVFNDGPPLGSWAVLDAEARARIGDAVLHVVWTNLTDIRAYGSPYYPIGDRALWFGLRWEFLN